MKRPRIWPVLLAASVGFAILCGLGVWQVQRLSWKEGLIAAIDRQIALDPVEVGAAGQSPAEYLKVKARGQYLNAPILRMMAARDGGAGWRLIHPFVTSEGLAILVDRGVAAADASPAVPQGVTEIVGLLRRHDSRPGTFDPPNDARANRWYWWDVPAMMAVLPEGRRASYVLQLLPGNPGSEGLETAAPKAALRNNHLGYAITWFGLAAALAAVTAVYVRGLSKGNAGPAAKVE